MNCPDCGPLGHYGHTAADCPIYDEPEPEPNPNDEEMDFSLQSGAHGLSAAERNPSMNRR